MAIPLRHGSKLHKKIVVWLVECSKCRMGIPGDRFILRVNFSSQRFR
ncbi:hypothetical protein V6Z12_A08G094700 [Gossypium hirsutum]